MVERTDQPTVLTVKRGQGKAHPKLTLLPPTHLEGQTKDNKQLFNLSESYFLICEKENNNISLSEFL